jgi:hypothetical protein
MVYNRLRRNCDRRAAAALNNVHQVLNIVVLSKVDVCIVHPAKVTDV